MLREVVAQPVLEVTENLAQQCPISGRSGESSAWFGMRDSKRARTKSKRSGKQCSVLMTLANLLMMAACGGSMASQKSCSALPPPTNCTANCTITIPPPPEFLYATSTNQILAFTINQSTGALSAAQVMAGPSQSNGMVASPNGQLYVSDFLNDAVDGYSISSSGVLTAVTGSPFSLGGTPPGAGGLAAFAANSYVYATDSNAGTVAGFVYDSSSGTLTPVPGSPIAAGNTPVQALVAEGQFLYVSNLNDSEGGISAFTINVQNGALTAISGSPYPTGTAGSFPGPSAMVVSNGNAGTVFLYVALVGTANVNNQIAAFAIDLNTGSLTAVPGFPFSTGNQPAQMAYVPLGGTFDVIYTANAQDNTITAFAADHATGVLTAVSGSPYPAGSSVGGLAVVNAAGLYILYQSDPQGQSVRAYNVATSTGALTAVSGSPFSASGYAPALLTSAVVP